MKNVILHIGMHKTGTSSIQECLSSYDDGKKKYAQFGISNHSIPITTIFSEKADEYHIWQNQGVSRERVHELKNGYLALLELQLSDPTHDTLIISAEDIGVLEYEEKLLLIDFFKSRNIQLRVICFTRDPYNLASSSIQQHIKGGIEQITRLNIRYKFCIECFQENIPSHNVLVKDYGQEIAKFGDIVSALANICDLKISDIDILRENNSLSSIATKLIFRFNRLPVNSFGTTRRVKARHDLIDFISQIFPADHAQSMIDKEITAGLIHINLEEIEYLRDKFDIDYDVNEDRFNLEDCTSYFDDLRDVEISFFKDKIEKSGLDCNDGDSIDALLISLYYHLLYGRSLEDADATYLRDIAVKIADGKDMVLEDAFLLMTLASRARPAGPFIKSKLEEYGNLLRSV